MSQNDDSFRLKTLIFCLIVFLLVTFAHVLSMYVQTEQTVSDIQNKLNNSIPDTVRTELENNMRNQTKIDAISILSSFVAITLGVDMPMPMPIVLSIFNLVIIISMAYVLSSIIRSYIPFVSG